MKKVYEIRIEAGSINEKRARSILDTLDIEYQEKVLYIRENRTAEPKPGYIAFAFLCGNPFSIRKLNKEFKDDRILMRKVS